jgi:hypothetical protein
LLHHIPQKSKTTSSLTSDLKVFLTNRGKNVAEAPRAVNQQHLDVQVLMGEMETLLNSMDQADARVQRILAKFHELKTAVLLTEQKE